MLPLDAARLLEAEGVFGKLHDYYYVTVGNVTAVASAARYGHEIGERLRKEGVQAVISEPLMTPAGQIRKAGPD